MNFVRKQLYLYALRKDEDMTINNIKKFIHQYKKSIIKATLLMEFIKVRKIQNKARSIDPEKKLPIDILYLIIEQSGF